VLLVKKRANLDTNSTFGDLSTAISDLFNISPEEQIISATPFHDPTLLDCTSNTLLTDLDLRHGSRLYLSLNEDARSRLNKATALTTFTQKSMTLTQANAKWQKELDENPAEKEVKYLPFEYWMNKKQREYRSQPWNFSDVAKYDYRPLKYSSGQNKLKMKELPSNCVLHRQQEYRHVDSVVFEDADSLMRFRTRWLDNPSVQRAAMLFGKIEKFDSPKTLVDGEKQVVQWVKASVFGLWEMPQTHTEQGVKITKSANKMLKKKRAVLEAMGLEPVGWLVTTQEREDEEGTIFLTASEIVQACKFQHAFRNPNTGFSKFVTIVLHEDETKNPDGYMISDQGLAMVRDGLVKAGEERRNLQVNIPDTALYQPAVVSKGRANEPGEYFEPEILIIALQNAGIPLEPRGNFRFVDVFQYCKKEGIFPSRLDRKIISFMLRHPERRNLPLHLRCSDFLLLLLLPEFISEETACLLASAVLEERNLTVSEKNIVDSALSQFQM